MTPSLSALLAALRTGGKARSKRVWVCVYLATGSLGSIFFRHAECQRSIFTRDSSHKGLSSSKGRTSFRMTRDGTKSIVGYTLPKRKRRRVRSNVLVVKALYPSRDGRQGYWDPRHVSTLRLRADLPLTAAEAVSAILASNSV